MFFFEGTRFVHSQHACDNNSPCIPLYKSLWKAGAGPDQRANPEENFSRYPDVANSLAFTETIDYWSKAPDLYGQSS